MNRQHPLPPILLTLTLAAAAVLFVALATLPPDQPLALRAVAGLAAALWLAGAGLAARPLIGYAVERRRYRGVLRGD